MARSDSLLMDTQRIIVGATAALDLETETLNSIFAPRTFAGAGVLAGLINPGYLIFAWSRTGWGDSNPCLSAVEEARKMKGLPEPLELPDIEPPAGYSPFAGCSRISR